MNIKEYKRQARENLTGKYQTPVSAFLIVTLISTLISLPFSMLQTETATTMQHVLYFVAEFLILLLTMLLNIGIIKIHLALANKQTCSINDLLYAFKNRTDTFFLASLLFVVINMICYVPALICFYLASHNGDSTPLFLLFLVITIVGAVIEILLDLNFALIFPLLLEHPDFHAMTAYRKSYELMQGRKAKLFTLFLSFIGLGILCVLSFFIGSLWVSPYLMQSYTNFYKEVTKPVDYAV